ncbi:MAG: hypothetical protein ACLPH3_10110 [Terracidiphilus sp.]
MHPFWLLPAMAPAALTYYIGRIKRTGAQKHRESPPFVFKSSDQPLNAPVSIERQTRLMRWVSIGEFMTVLTKYSDLIVFDLRTDVHRFPLTDPNPSVLHVKPNELASVLEWLPANKSAAFGDSSDLCIFLIEKCPSIDRLARLYLLEGDLGFAEVA